MAAAEAGPIASDRTPGGLLARFRLVHFDDAAGAAAREAAGSGWTAGIKSFSCCNSSASLFGALPFLKPIRQIRRVFLASGGRLLYRVAGRDASISQCAQAHNSLMLSSGGGSAGNSNRALPSGLCVVKYVFPCSISKAWISCSGGRRSRKYVEASA